MSNLAQQYADSLAESLAEIVAAIEAGDEYEGEPAAEYLEAMPLELVSEIGEPFAVVLTTGGPHAEIEWGARYGTDSAALVCYWGGDRARIQSPAIRYVAECFAELMGCDE